ncbi:hypothetical protein ACWED2_01750 [Amycolatopsis sp. NPDC005003]
MLFGFLALHLAPHCPTGHPEHAPASGRVATVVVQHAQPLPEHDDGCDPAHGHHPSPSTGDAVYRGFRLHTDSSWLPAPTMAAAWPLRGAVPARHLRPTADPPVAGSGKRHLLELCVSRT